MSTQENHGSLPDLKTGKLWDAHESAYIDEPCSIGAGTKIWHFSHVMQGAVIGENCSLGQNVVISPQVILGDGVRIQNNVSVYTGVVCEDDVFLGPSCVFTNVINPRSFVPRKDEYRQTLIRRGASIGANATIICGNKIGCYALVGAGAVVTRSLPDFALAVGAPARVVGYVCRCGEKLIFERETTMCTACGTTYEKQGELVKEK
ncbi:acyltransferase [Hydrogenoanaerobacterium sp.]|uniref:acyltransferase n=1 Tax=Hydrogenoanaerobacterium sp. TaxID=2953763 RepID=UPI0028A2D5DC|nr:acyltransferase [Hydrogenoanaerobacterium sp.]